MRSYFAPKKPGKKESNNALAWTGALLGSTNGPKLVTTERHARTDVPTEYEEQVALVKWLDIKGYLFSATAQSTWTPSFGVIQKLKMSGVRKGFPDLAIIKGDKLIFVELKRIKKSYTKVGDEQKIWLEQLNNVSGVRAQVCYGCEEAIKFIESVK